MRMLMEVIDSPVANANYSTLATQAISLKQFVALVHLDAVVLSCGKVGFHRTTLKRLC
jgi:hypothetical protein